MSVQELSAVLQNHIGKSLKRQLPISKLSSIVTPDVDLDIQDNTAQYANRLSQLLEYLESSSSNTVDSGIYIAAEKVLDNTPQLSLKVTLDSTKSFKIISDVQHSLDNVNKYLGTKKVLALDALGKRLEELRKQTESVISTLPSAMRTVANANMTELVKMRGSDSIEEHVQKAVIAALGGKSVKASKTKYPSKKILDIPTKVSINDTLKQIKNMGALLRKVTLKVTATPIKKPSSQIRDSKGQFYSLTSLQNFINLSLHEQIKKNMGMGNETSILNYRTGRFAESASVDRISQSKAGLITAFYNYMRYPYATFSSDSFHVGAQSIPISRDPKLLISKSIREIASAKVSYRLRAVSDEQWYRETNPYFENR